MSSTCSRTAVRTATAAASRLVRATTSTSSRSFSILTRNTTQRSVPVSVSRAFTRSFATEAVKVPALGDSISEGTIVKWQKNVGEFAEADEVIVVIETDKVSVDIRAPKAGVIKAQKAKEGETVKVGQDLADLDTDAKGSAAAPAAPKPAAAAAAAAPAAAAQPAAPAAPAAAAPAAPKVPAAEKPAAPKAPQVTIVPGSRNERRVPMTRMRQTIAKRLKDAQNTAAMLTTFNEIDMTNIMNLRNQYKDEFAERHGVKFGFMSAFVRASTVALLKNPDVNAYITGNEIIYHDFVDISVAVSTPTGLVVPVLRNTENMSFAQIEAAIGALGQKARKGQIAIEDMTGGTFTISNGGVYGSLMGTPIINPPQSAILGMHGIFKRPVVVNDKVEIRPMMYVALTYDHRIIDGQGAVTFLKDVKAAVEEPTRLLLDL